MNIMTYNETHYKSVASNYPYNNLRKIIGEDELLNHISTVFYYDDVSIEVGKRDVKMQAYMRNEKINYLIGMTPKYPIFDPNSSDEQNQIYVDEFKAKLDRLDIAYIPCQGRARDFKEGGNGCFILINLSPSEVIKLLMIEDKPSQLSFTCIDQYNAAELISCIDSLN